MNDRLLKDFLRFQIKIGDSLLDILPEAVRPAARKLRNDFLSGVAEIAASVSEVTSEVNKDTAARQNDTVQQVDIE